MSTHFIFYVIYRCVISEWRSISPMEINQYDITLTTHYDITMGNDVARDIHCDVTMSNDVTMWTYHYYLCILHYMLNG